MKVIFTINISIFFLLKDGIGKIDKNKMLMIITFNKTFLLVYVK